MVDMDEKIIMKAGKIVAAFGTDLALIDKELMERLGLPPDLRTRRAFSAMCVVEFIYQRRARVPGYGRAWLYWREDFERICPAQVPEKPRGRVDMEIAL